MTTAISRRNARQDRAIIAACAGDILKLHNIRVDLYYAIIDHDTYRYGQSDQERQHEHGAELRKSLARFDRAIAKA